MAGATLVVPPGTIPFECNEPRRLLVEHEFARTSLEMKRGGSHRPARRRETADAVPNSTLSKVVDPKKKDDKWFKFAFLLGSVHLCLSAYWLGSRPSTFYKLYSVQAVALLGLRWAYFKSEKMHYYMFDFCYAANVLLLAYVWVWPKSNFLKKVLFAYNTGPLALSVPVFGNSLVYHSLNELTGLFIHWYPMLVTYTIRWYPDCKMDDSCGRSIDPNGIAQNANFLELQVWPLLPYLGWAFFYYLKIFIVSSGKIKTRSYETIYGYMTDGDQLCGRVVKRFPLRWQPPMFMVFHFCMVILSIIPVPMWWGNFTAHSALVVFVTGVSMWNGAAFYIRI
ncbi:hypothetical protein BSKO_03294 [Bryopsis sp. KO-2023]|nr:hypothetical protein BSKO_03294 [Bryopsis sp. KO-2023]